MNRLAGLAVVIACGGIGCGGDGGTDVPGDGSTTGDGSNPGGDGGGTVSCNPAKPFDAPVAVTELNSLLDDQTPTLTADQLTVLFASNRAGGAGGLDLYISTRPSRGNVWSTPAPLGGVNTAANQSRPMLTADGLTLYAETTTGSDWNLSKATRATPQASFGPLQAEPVINGNTFDMSPSVLPDGSTIFFVSDRNGSNDLYRATRTGTTWSAPAIVPGANVNSSDWSESYPLISADALTLYFASDRPGGLGLLDIYVAKRATPTSAFDDPVLVTELNTAVNDLPSWLSSDGCELWLSRLVPSSGQELLVARRPSR